MRNISDPMLIVPNRQDLTASLFLVLEAAVNDTDFIAFPCDGI